MLTNTLAGSKTVVSISRDAVVLNSVTSTLQWIRQPEPRDTHAECVLLERDDVVYWYLIQ